MNSGFSQKKSPKNLVVSKIVCTFAVIKTIKVMMDASKTYTNDTLTTSRKPAAKSLFISTPPPIYKHLRILILCISALFALTSCEKQDSVPYADLSTTFITKTVVTPDSLLGDWHVLSAVVPVGTSSITADIAWEGTMMEITEDSVRFHRHDLVYPASYPGETIDVTLSTYPVTYTPDGHVTIAAVPLAVFQTEVGTLILRGKDIEIEIKSVP